MTGLMAAFLLGLTLIISITPSAIRADCLSWFSDETQGWEKYEEEPEIGMTIFFQKGSNYYRFKGIMEVNASREALVDLLSDPEGKVGECHKLFPRCKTALIVSRNCERVDETFQGNGEDYQAMTFQSTWPAKDRYVVLHRVYTNDDGKGTTELRATATTNLCQEPKLQRMKEQLTTWRFQSKGEVTCVSYDSYSDPDTSGVPRWFVNSELRNAVFETLKNMKCLRSEDQDWKKRNCKSS